jgi:hypothetical protein
VEKVIDLLDAALSHMGKGHELIVMDLIKKAMREAKRTSRLETPAQYRRRTWKDWPDNAAVRILNLDGEWELMEYWRAKQLEQDLARLDKDFGDDPEGLIIVCDRGEAGPPPKGWRPEEN